MDWVFGISRCKLLHIEWINNTVLLYSTGNDIWYPIIIHNGKELPFLDCDDSWIRACYQREWLAFLVYFFYFLEKPKLSDSSITVFFISTKDKNKNTFEVAAVSKVPSLLICYVITQEPSEVAIIILLIFKMRHKKIKYLTSDHTRRQTQDCTHSCLTLVGILFYIGFHGRKSDFQYLWE